MLKLKIFDTINTVNFVPLLLINLVLTALLGVLHHAFDLRIKVMDEQLRQYFWFFNQDTSEPSVAKTAIIDLYTSATYNASPDQYAARYQSYELVGNLSVFCKLGAPVLALDFFLDNETWLARHFSAHEGDRTAFLQALSCFREVWIPTRVEAGAWQLPFEPILALENVRLGHVETYESVAYSSYLSALTSKGTLTLPYLARGLVQGTSTPPESQLNKDFSAISMAYTPNQFPRMRFEDYEVFRELVPSLDQAALRAFFRQFYASGEREVPIPTSVILGFSHDVEDHHQVAFNLAGPLNLPVAAKGESGHEPAVAGTPGMYLVASTANALAENNDLYLLSAGSIGFLVVMAGLGVALLWFVQRLDNSLQIAGVFLVAVFSYLLLAYGTFGLAQVGLPFTVPILYAVILWIVAEYFFGASFLRVLLGGSAQKTSNQVLGDDATPNSLLYARAIRDSQTDTYKALHATVDLMSFWMQYAALVLMAEKCAQDSSMRPFSKQDWERWYRPMLGNFVFGFFTLAQRHENRRKALEQSFFPELFDAMRDRQHGNIKDVMQQALAFRTDWKHFASSAASELVLEQALEEAQATERQLILHYQPLLAFQLIKPVKLRSRNDGVSSWMVLLYSGWAPRLEEIATRDELTEGKLYLFQRNKPGRSNNTFCLEPWVVAGECQHHHREEIFFYMGIRFDKESKKPLRTASYMGLTQACCPARDYELDERLFKLVTR